MRLVAVFNEAGGIARYLAAVGEATEVPRRSPSHGPPYWRSQVLGDGEGWGGHGAGAEDVAWQRGGRGLNGQRPNNRRKICQGGLQQPVLSGSGCPCFWRVEAGQGGRAGLPASTAAGGRMRETTFLWTR
jgi:hypothetical protein